jgi:hypothetical protein
MSTFKSLREALDERVLSERITIPHDEARLKYRLTSNTVRDASEFERIIGDYYAYHHGQCVSHGGKLPEFQAVQAAKRIIENVYRRRNQTILNAISDGTTGNNGGMRQMLDFLNDALKNESLESYIEETFDRHVQVDSWTQKVAVIREVQVEFGHLLPERIRARAAEELAANYKDLLRGIIDGLRETAAAFRRV